MSGANQEEEKNEQLHPEVVKLTKLCATLDWHTIEDIPNEAYLYPSEVVIKKYFLTMHVAFLPEEKDREARHSRLEQAAYILKYLCGGIEKTGQYPKDFAENTWYRTAEYFEGSLDKLSVLFIKYDAYTNKIFKEDEPTDSQRQCLQRKLIINKNANNIYWEAEELKIIAQGEKELQGQPPPGKFVAPRPKPEKEKKEDEIIPAGRKPQKPLTINCPSPLSFTTQESSLSARRFVSTISFLGTIATSALVPRQQAEYVPSPTDTSPPSSAVSSASSSKKASPSSTNSSVSSSGMDLSSFSSEDYQDVGNPQSEKENSQQRLLNKGWASDSDDETTAADGKPHKKRGCVIS